jgi:C-terminal processing protease CtpA/Prc
MREDMIEVLGPPPSGDPSQRRVEGDSGYVTIEHLAIPNAAHPPIRAKVYLLTSRKTASAAEHFSLALKATGRGTLVGAPTLGANHYGGIEDIGGGLEAFIPFGRTYDIATGKDWESVGVAPDIAVDPAMALVEVLVREGVARKEAEAISQRTLPKGLEPAA